MNVDFCSTFEINFDFPDWENRSREQCDETDHPFRTPYTTVDLIWSHIRILNILTS